MARSFVPLTLLLEENIASCTACIHLCSSSGSRENHSCAGFETRCIAYEPHAPLVLPLSWTEVGTEPNGVNPYGEETGPGHSSELQLIAQRPPMINLAREISCQGRFPASLWPEQRNGFREITADSETLGPGSSYNTG